MPFNEVLAKAKALDAIPFDIPDVEYTHYGEECTFDYIIKKHSLKDNALQTLAVIVRGADTDRHDIASQSSGLWAISAGLSHDTKDDHALLEKGMMLYDALYTWAKFLQNEKHTQNPFEIQMIRKDKDFMKGVEKISDCPDHRTSKLPVEENPIRQQTPNKCSALLAKACRRK